MGIAHGAVAVRHCRFPPLGENTRRTASAYVIEVDHPSDPRSFLEPIQFDEGHEALDVGREQRLFTRRPRSLSRAAHTGHGSRCGALWRTGSPVRALPLGLFAVFGWRGLRPIANPYGSGFCWEITQTTRKPYESGFAIFRTG